MLLDPLALSQINYALPVWDPGLVVSYLLHLHICITKFLSKHDHVSHHYETLNWLSVASQMQYRSLCAMYCPSYAVLLDPPIVFGPKHAHCTQCTENFANLDRCRLSHKTFSDIMLHTGPNHVVIILTPKSIYLHSTWLPFTS